MLYSHCSNSIGHAYDYVAIHYSFSQRTIIFHPSILSRSVALKPNSLLAFNCYS